MLSKTEDYKLSLYIVEKEIHTSVDCNIYLTKSSLDNKLYIKRIYKNSNMSELFNSIKNKNVRNIPQIYEIFYDGTDTIVIEEYILGNSVESVDLTKKSLYKVINSILLSVEDLHSIDIIHRDIKPSNILITTDHKVYLIDFGIARFYSDTLDADTTRFGTKGFASPEQYGFQQTDCRSDIYSIGKTIEALLKANNINVPLKKIISKSIAFDPKDRYGSVKELKMAINVKILYGYMIPIAVIFVLVILTGFLYAKDTKRLNVNQTETLEETTTNNTETLTESISIIETETDVETTNASESTTSISKNSTKITTVPKKNNTTASNSKKATSDNNVSNSKNININKYSSDTVFYNTLIVPEGTDYMELSGDETQKTGSIEMNNSYVTVECIKNYSTLTVNFSDTAGHRNSLTLNYTEEQLKNSLYPDSHTFNAYIFFLDFNGDGNTEIFVNFTDISPATNIKDEIVYESEDSKRPAWLLKNYNILRLVDYSINNGFYIYNEGFSLIHDYNFVYAGGDYVPYIYSEEDFANYTTRDGVIIGKSLLYDGSN